MSSTTFESYLATLRRSGLVEDDQLEKLLRELQSASGDSAVNSGILSKKLLDEELITDWQQEKLAQGKHKGFFLGKYKLLSHLGTGGMSSVYLAEHTLMRRRVAIKVLPSTLVGDSSYLDRFHREARAIAQLDHPNIVRAYNVDNEGKVHYIVMEYVEGADLERYTKDKRKKTGQSGLPFEEAAEYTRQAASGLEHAHGRKMIHRDIKPSNLLRDKTGTVKILDMGLARLTGKDERALTIEHNETVLGTTDYLAPEQAINSHEVDHRADIYALGCSLYFLLTGLPPFPEGTLAQRLMKHQTEEPESILTTRPDCPEDLLAIVHKLTRKKPEERYQTAGAAEKALAEWLETNGHAVGGSAGTGSSTIARSAGSDSTMNVRTRSASKSRLKAPGQPPRVTTPESGAGRSDADLRGFLNTVGQEQENSSVIDTRPGMGSSKVGQSSLRSQSSIERKPKVPVWVWGVAGGGGLLLLILLVMFIPSSDPTTATKKGGSKSPTVSPKVTKKLNPRGEKSFAAFGGIPFGNRHTLSFDVEEGGDRALALKVSSGPPNAWAKVLLDGKEIVAELEMGDLTTGEVQTFSLGNHILMEGSHDLVVELDARSVRGKKPDWVSYESWYLLGPFKRDWNKAYAPEKEGFDANKEYNGRDGKKIKWVKKNYSNGKTHDLQNHLKPNSNITYYLGRKIKATRADTLPIYLGSDDSIKVFINNKQAYANKVDRGVESYSDTTSIQLNEGDNFLLLKIGQGTGGTGFFYTDVPNPGAVSVLPFEFGLEYPVAK